MSLALRYALFCAIGASINLGAQWVCTQLFAAHLVISMAVGTAAGLVPKYLLDRNYIFNGRGVDAREDARRFFVYSCLGAANTLVFWLIEWLATLISPHPGAQYIGGVIGLVLTYYAKYLMDRRWVFNTRK